MHKKTLLILSVVISFCMGFAIRAVTSKKNATSGAFTRKVTGIGGVFFKSKDPKALKEWYRVHLGLDAGPYGATFEWRLAGDSAKKGATEWSVFSEKTHYFDPSPKDFMIDYRVERLDQLLPLLKMEGVTVVDSIEAVDYGKFVHILDPEGNKIELWEPK